MGVYKGGVQAWKGARAKGHKGTRAKGGGHKGKRAWEVWGHKGCEGRWKLGFWVYTASEYKKFKQVQLWPVVLRCPHHLPSRFTTTSTFTEQQKTFIGPHHGPKFWDKKPKPTTKVTPTSLQWSLEFKRRSYSRMRLNELFALVLHGVAILQ